MEYALRRKIVDGGTFLQWVLILVLMEYALRQNKFSIYKIETNEVLILVLMEYALRQPILYISHF